MNKTRIKAHIILSLLLIGVFIAISIMLLRFNSDRFAREFFSQNYKEIESGNVFVLIPQLNSLVNQESISCIKAHSNGKIFFTSECNNPFLGRHISIKGNHIDVSIELIYFLSETILLFLEAILIITLLASNYILMMVFKVEDIRQDTNLKLGHLAKQVAHDIRSPLSALTMVIGTLNDLPEEKRMLIRSATQRINDIANGLLHNNQSADLEVNINNEGGEESKALSNSEQMNLPVYFIPSLVDILVSEKRMQYRECTGLEIEIDLENSFGLFSRINSNELKRALSNLINNAIEALNNHQGKVIVGVRKINNDGTLLIEISVKDNGKGIPKNLISKLGQSEISFGKTSSKESGSGLGLYHAKRMAEYFGGRLKIESTEGSGSTICLILPLSENPQWFANMIDLTNKTFLISLDDDISIHQIWSDRLQSLNLKRLEHIKFQSCDAFEKYVNANINKLGQTLFLVDHELLNQNKTGLELIEELGLEKYSILVTSHYEDLKIQNQSLRLNLPILPKSLAGFVPIIIKS